MVHFGVHLHALGTHLGLLSIMHTRTIKRREARNERNVSAPKEGELARTDD